MLPGRQPFAWPYRSPLDCVPLELCPWDRQEVPAGGYKHAGELLPRHGDEWFPLAPGETRSLQRSAAMFAGRGLPDSLGVSSSGPPAEEIIAWWSARYPIRHIYVGRIEPEAYAPEKGPGKNSDGRRPLR